MVVNFVIQKPILEVSVFISITLLHGAVYHQEKLVLDIVTMEQFQIQRGRLYILMKK